MEKKLTITLTADRKVTVEGPLDDWLVCYGMLTEAIQIVRRRAEQNGGDSAEPEKEHGWRG